MRPDRAGWIGALVLALATAGAVADLQRSERSTIVVYTTPALRDLLEQDIVPRFERQTGYRVALVYVPAGQQYNRLRIGGERAEADLFLHASPLYLEKSRADGRVDPFRLDLDEAIDPAFKSREVRGGRSWYAFAWSPLVEVCGQDEPEMPDLLDSTAPFGFPHPLLSNNGVYAVLFFESASRAAGRNALAHTRVQPTNARANIGGLAEGSFGLTIGYEAVVRFFQEQGARVRCEVPLVEGRRVTTPVLLSAALIHGDRHPAAEALVRSLFSEETQAHLARYHFHGVLGPPATGLLEVGDAERVDYDWSRWRELEAWLPDYEVKQ